MSDKKRLKDLPEFEHQIPMAYRLIAENNARLRRMWWVDKGVHIFLILGILALLPLKEKIVEYVEFINSEGQYFVRVHKAGKDLRANETLLSYALREYVKNRETIDKAQEEINYPKVQAMSVQKESEKFRLLAEPLFKQEGFKRHIEIVQDSALYPPSGADDGAHQLEIVMYTTDESRKSVQQRHQIQKCLVTLKYNFFDQEVPYEERFFNPLGLFITEYTLVKKDS